MKFFLDANLPYSSKEIFEKFGKALHARDIGLQSAPDEEIFKFAVQRKAVLVTRDLEFGNPYLYPRDSCHGLIILRVPSHFTTKQINKVFKEFLTSVEVEELKKLIIVVEPERVRMRKLE